MGEGSEGLEDFNDSFLKELARAPLPLKGPGPGARLGGREGRRFEVLDTLGGGAMGEVFRARDTELQRVVALKFFQTYDTGAREETLAAMLRQEARAIAQLDHENIVRIFDVGEWSGVPGQPRVPFLVMECLEGESLAALLERERPGLGRALGIMHGVARGLAHAHERHLIHRDLKPSNIFLTRQGTVKLLDFGLAHLVCLAGAAVPPLAKAGTPPYMAPEQWRGGVQDARTDLWAVGVVLYELLTGERPYPSPSLEALRARVLAPEPVPSVRARAPELPEEVARLVAQALEKEPARRLSSAAELAERLHQLQLQLGPWREEPHALGPQRRQVTLVSCRLLGRASLPERGDPEDFLEVEEDFHRKCALLLQRHGGFVTHLLGEEVLACFGYPVAREDDSERAVRAGLDLLRYFREEPPHLAGHPLSVGVGVHTDAVVLTVSPQPSPGMGPALQGEAPEVASRLAERAGPGGVALGATTQARVHGAFETEPLDTPDAWRVLRERKAVTRFERVLATGKVSRLVGRERELQTLLGLWAEAREGRGAFVLVSGEAGIGKSRLIQELLGRVDPASAYLLQAQCWAQLESSAFAPVIDLLWRRFQLEPRALPRRELRGQLESRLAALGLLGEGGLEAWHVDSLVSLLSPALAEEAPPLPLPVEPQHERKRRTLEALRVVLSRMAGHQPVLAVVEDVHWADPSTLELLGHLLDSTGRQRLLVLLSARPGFSPPWPPRPGFHRLELGRLSAESTARLAREVARDRALSEEQVAQLVAKTDGIPLFIEELTRRVLDRAPSSIPVTLQELLASRLDALPPRQRTLLWLGAGVGRRFTPALLAALSRRSEAELRGDLEALVAAGVLQRDDSDEPGYRFHHALLQDVAWGSLPRGRRREFHRHIAQVLEARFPDLGEARPEVLAHHYTEAGELARAFPYRTQAAELALQRSAHVEATTQLRQALALLRSLPDASRRAAQEVQLLNALGLSLLSTEGYFVPEIEQIHARVLELSAQQEAPLPGIDLLWMWLCGYFIMGGRLPLALDIAERLQALGQQRGDTRLSAHSYRQLAIISRERGELVRCLEWLDRARALSREELDAADLGFTLDSLWVDLEVDDAISICLVRMVMGELQQAWRGGLEALARARRLNQPTTLAFTLAYLAGAAQLLGDASRTLEWAEECMREASRLGLRPTEEAARALQGWALARLGRPQEGLEVMRAGLEHWQRGAWLFVPYIQGLFAEVQGRLGQVREGLALVAKSLEDMEARGLHFCEPELHRIQGELLRALGAHGEAVRSFLRARIVARRQQAALLELRATVALARLLRERGQEEQARRRLVRACQGTRVDPEAPDFQQARVLLEPLSMQPEGAWS